MKNKNDIHIVVGSLGGGGAERVAINLANNMSEKVTLLSLTYYQDYDLNTLHKNVNLINFGNKRIRESIISYLLYLRKNKPQIILSISRDTNLVLAFIEPFLNYKPKLIFRETNTIENMSKKIPNHQFLSKIIHKYFKFLLRIIISFSYLKCSKIIVSSKDVADDIKSFLIFKKPIIKVIKPPILPTNFNNNNVQDCHDLWIKNSSIQVILGVGRLCEQKRFDILIKAFAIVNDNYPNTRLIICGKGEKEVELKSLTNELKISEFVCFKGFLKDPYPYLKYSDIFCLSSDFEGFGLVIIEAMAFGTKIVTTKCKGAPSSLIDNKYIDFSPLNNYETLADNIVRSLYLPSPKPFLIKESKQYNSEERSLHYLKELI